MKKLLLTHTLIGSIFFIGLMANAQSKDASLAQKTVHDYFSALNASNADKVVSLFAKDGVLLPTGAPTAEGTVQLKGNYDYVFDNFSFDLKETIESVFVFDDYAYVRSTSKGSLLIKSENQKVTEDFREVFVLKKINGDWKIDTYMYNQSK
jgi:uncharacterized protein (TIGR02246 family)